MAPLPPNFTLSQAFSSAEEEPVPSTPQWDPNDPALIDKLAGVRDEQQAALQQHEQYAAGLQRAGQQVAERQQDLVIAERFSQLLSPDIPRPAKQYLFRETARVLGLDPRSAATKDLGSLLTQLDPDSAQALRGMLVAQSREAQPGQVREMARALLSGNVPMSDIMRQVSEFQRGQVADDQQRLGDVFGAGLVHRVSDTTRVPVPPQTEQPPSMQAIAPELRPLLGLPTDRQFRHQDLQDMGINIPSDAAGQRTLANTLRTEQANAVTMLDRVGRLQSVLDDPATMVGASGLVAQGWDAVREQGANLLRMFGIGVDPSLDPSKGESRFEAERLTRALLRTYGIEKTAQNTAIVRSMVAELGYVVAGQLFGQQGRNLSDADYAAALRTLGGDVQSKDQFSAVLASLASRAHDTYSTRVSSAVGVPLGLNVTNLPDDQLRRLGRARTTPTHIREGIAAEMERRDALTSSRAVDDQPPGQPRQPTDAPRAPADAQPREPSSQTQRETRRRPTVEEEQTALRAQAAEAQRLVREAQQLTQLFQFRQDARAERSAALNEEQFNRSQRWRDEDKAERAQQRLQQIFERLGAMIARGGGGGGGGGRSGGGGGEQSPAAFQLPARGQRRAPQVPQLPLRGFDGLKGK